MPHRADVLILGTGQAGVPLATRMAREGRRVVVFERDHLGGTCVNRGCTPSKTLIASAHAAWSARRAGDFGVVTGAVRVDVDAVIDRVESTVETWRSGVESNFEDAGESLEVVREHARFVEPGVVRAGDAAYTAERIVVNTGARPAVPDLPGLDGVDWLSSTDAIFLREIPEHLVVLGGGYVGCELGQAWRRLGAPVTIVDRNDRLLHREDPDVTAELEEAFRAEGVELALGVGAVSVEGTDDGGGGRAGTVRLDDGRALDFSHLLVAVGRVPNTDDLGCEAAGIELDEGGFIRIDDRYRTRAGGVWAVGDVTGGAQFTHASWDDHRILFDLWHGDDRRTRADRLVPSAVFTDPQVARVGLSEGEARRRGVDHDVATLPFSTVARAAETDRSPGIVKVLLDPDDDRILGAAVVGAEAAELIHVFVVLMQAGASARALIDAEMVHPAFAEGLQTAVMTLERHAL